VLTGGAVVKEHRPGLYPLYRVEKRGIDTFHMAKEVSSELRSRVSYCGLKDSRAVAVQYLTPTSRNAQRPERIARERFTALLTGYLPKPLTRSSLIGNRFAIVLRDCCGQVKERIEETFKAGSERRIPNYFGLQRFGTKGAGTHLVGKALVLGDFEGAVSLILDRTTDQAGAESGGLKKGQDVERAVSGEIDRHPGDWIGALRAVPVGLRRLYVQAYQSYLFNLSLSRALEAGEDISCYIKGDNWAEVSEDGLVSSYPRSAKDAPGGGSTPLVQVVGYAYRNYGSRFDAHIGGVLRAEGVAPGGFFLREMQEVSAEGGFRRPHIAMAHASWRVEDGAATLSFTLARGQYATVLLREILKPDDPQGTGLF